MMFFTSSIFKTSAEPPSKFYNIGNHSPNCVAKSIDRVIDECQHTGILLLASRKLKYFPKSANNYDICDTSVADLSKNQLQEVPLNVCELSLLESLNLHRNLIKSIPPELNNLQNLVQLNLSNNLLVHFPIIICHLQQLSILTISGNKIHNFPEEISCLSRLTYLDASCNEISQLPHQLGELASLRHLNLRRNHLLELPICLSRLKLRYLNVSANRIAHIPCDFRKVITLEELHVEENPLVSPPAQLSNRGLIHIMKFLNNEATKGDRRRILSNTDSLMRRRMTRSSSFSTTLDSQWNGLEGSKAIHQALKSMSRQESTNETIPQQPPSFNHHPIEVNKNDETLVNVGNILNLNNATIKLEQWLRQEPNGMDYGSRSLKEPLNKKNGEMRKNNDSLDAISRELHRQKEDYEKKKKRAEMLKKNLDEAKTDDEKNKLLITLNSSTANSQKLTTTTLTKAPLENGISKIQNKINIQNVANHSNEYMKEILSKNSSQPQKIEVIKRITNSTVFKNNNNMINKANPNEKATGNHFNKNHINDGLIQQHLLTQNSNGNIYYSEKELIQIDKMKQSLESMLKIKLGENMEDSLKNGVVLCHLANYIRTRSVPCIHIPSPAAPILSQPKCRRNVENFLLACRRIGLDQQLICSASSILEDHGLASIAMTVNSLVIQHSRTKSSTS